MKLHRKKNKKKLILLIVITAAIATGCFGLYLMFVQTQHTPTTTPTESKDSQTTKDNLDAKQSLIKDPNSQDAPASPTADENSITITSSQTSTDVMILTKLNSIASGSCTLQITNGSKTYTSTVAVIYQSEFSSCAGFTITKAILGGSGTWDVTLTVSNNQLKIAKTVAVEVK